ncbi:hypothetical protein [Azohydromonas lata]|uniref:Uncharacterized protein n=1 Tax=Azohydromonas lata TaxID=45677 RepID=A0ABU5INY7_9BURK|nr:hypothetical protein [Azohydromonas lata]MDZ5460602.1 hypothetical protein [Azohydromonas lata]
MNVLFSIGEKTSFELCFESLRDANTVMAFPCDETGHVDMDAMAEHTLNNYLYARAVIGHQFSRPLVRAVASS